MSRSHILKSIRCLNVAVAIAVVASMSAVMTYAQGGRLPSAQIIDYGRYRAKITSFSPAGENTSGYALVNFNDLTHQETTTRIPAKVGESFGFCVRFQNLPVGRDYRVRRETHHPPIRQPDGKVLTMSVTTDETSKAGTAPSGRELWHFTKGCEYELVPGKWTNKVFIDGKEVASMTFDVVGK